MRSLIRPAVVSLLLFTAATGLIYPAAVTGLAQLLFPSQANGTLIGPRERPVGSALIGQPFSDPKYFWGRPSATTPVPYNAAASASSNFGPLNPALVDSEVRPRIAQLHAAGTPDSTPIPVDLVTSSASGLDPDITPAAAAYQIGRVAHARGLRADVVGALVARATAGRQFGVFGEPRVNVLRLNLALDSTTGARAAPRD
jgi:potassium-transporting ATPase KdpC subunit